ncbi:T9SS type A sorting domain-containing protein [Flavobacterium sp. SM15]|uniref:T9SS type A sorting domain-containing protein n=1 Tax=Flavobacterium sp. SM15 TaxID=2908005 RepID=UPI001EDB5A8D|nr:T9SS type A sorting domain-containing protein [Flavobacterium sp. SM15]MCG2611788.1 T9SS type A sorting domain-containing protein [Flavobacterium sp. SM15]
MEKKAKLLFLVLFLQHVLYSQSPGNVKGCGVWIKNISTIEDVVSGREKNNKKKSHVLLNDLNFNSAIDFSKENQIILEKGILKNRFTIFMVYKSNDQKEKSILSAKAGNDNLSITTKKISNSGKIDYQKSIPDNGVILSYYSSANVSNSNLKFMYLGVEKDSISKDVKTSILEFIYYPRVLNFIERQKIETYLSIKYGVSLDGEKDYLNHKGEKIWDFKANKEFNNRVTGIGRNDLAGLNHKQSGNSKKDGIYISFGEKIDTLNVLNQTFVGNYTYLMWGDNGKSIKFQNNKDTSEPVSKMERLWKIQKISQKDSLKTTLLLNTEEFKNQLQDKYSKVTNNEKNKVKERFWLVIDRDFENEFDYLNSEYIKGDSISGKELLFKNIIWSNLQDKNVAFTFVKAPELFFNYETEAKDCNSLANGKINLNIHGGVAPYKVSLEKEGKTLFSSYYNNSEITIDNVLSSINYNIIVRDKNGQIYLKPLIINSFDAITCELASQWYLNQENQVLIKPILNSSDQTRFEWIKENKILSKENQFTAVEVGDYVLKVFNNRGCEKEIKFNVGDSSEKDNWVLYPNPVNKEGEFTIAFNLKNETPISITFFDMNGKKIKTTSLGKVTEYLYKDSINISGTYMILLSIGEKTESVKLIVE